MDGETNIYRSLKKLHEPYKPYQLYKEITVQESGMKFRGCFKPAAFATMFKIDGVFITEGNKCDNLLLASEKDFSKDVGDEELTGVFIELKGTDVKHGLLQLDSTLSHALFKKINFKDKRAVLVARSFPRNGANPEYEKEKRNFIARHKGIKFKQLGNNEPYNCIS